MPFTSTKRRKKMWRIMSEIEVEEQIRFEDDCGCNNTLQMLFDSRWEGKKISLWTFNEGQCFEVREEK